MILHDVSDREKERMSMYKLNADDGVKRAFVREYMCNVHWLRKQMSERLKRANKIKFRVAPT